MSTPTFKEQFDKITRAYISGELEPYNSCACFWGNILSGDEWVRSRWDVYARKFQFLDGYSFFDINKLETNFLTIINIGTINYRHIWGGVKRSRHPNYENALFQAMESTLDMLRKIHESRGEVIESFEFKKRELATL